jgi:RimJ/RimL family protein N-acetyltransferase
MLLAAPSSSMEMVNTPCPLLPEVDHVWQPREVLSLGKDRGPVFYTASLHYAQSQWQRGLPAQAILQLNRALATALPGSEPVLQQWPLPYRAMAWMIQQQRDGQFMGNPRRHFQHLATRMVEPQKNLRVWRAWACWFLSKIILPEQLYPADHRQIRDEGIIEPTYHTILASLSRFSPSHDVQQWQQALADCHFQPRPLSEHSFHPIQHSHELGTVQNLAHSIWPQVYPSIISLEQIQYMLEQSYSLAALQADHAAGSLYILIQHSQQSIGYLSYYPQQDSLFLAKLYLLPDFAGRGIGASALSWMKQQALLQGKPRIHLRVNKANAAAIRAYLRAGFQFSDEVCSDIGSGFVMDDYVMHWLSPTSQA